MCILSMRKRRRVGLRADRNDLVKVPKSQFTVFSLKVGFKTRLSTDQLKQCLVS